VAAALLLAAFSVWEAFPSPGQYQAGADEGVYYRQARALVEHGPLEGLRRNTREFLADPSRHVYPNPLRPLPALTNALGLAAADGYRTLSLLSLLWFLLTVAAVWGFARRLWGSPAAECAAVLVAFSPLGMAMAGRALIDSLTYLVTTLVLFTLLLVLERGGRGPLLAFALAVLLLGLNRETGILLYPFLLGALLLRGEDRPPGAPRREGVLALAAAGGATLLVFLAVYGPADLVRTLRAVVGANVANPGDYAVLYQSGPWQRSLVDLLLVSPLPLLLALLYAGAVVLSGEGGRKEWTVLAFAGWVVLVHSFLTKNLRYLVGLDLAVRLLAALGLAAAVRRLADGRRRTALLLAALLPLAGADLTSHRFLFREKGIYDPVSHNLLLALRMVPGERAATSGEAGTAAADSPEALLQESFLAHLAGNYRESLRLSREILRRQPDHAAAWNNVCAAHNSLEEWDRAVEACRRAAELDPSSELARNNLSWALRGRSGNQ
jgi:hypothetical protein